MARGTDTKNTKARLTTEERLIKTSKIEQFEKKYNVRRKGITTVIENLKQRVQKAPKVERYEERATHYSNKMKRDSARNLMVRPVIRLLSPMQTKAKTFWSGIWSVGNEHN